MTEFVMGHRWALLRKPSFALYLLACFLSTFGSGLCYITANWLVLSLRNDVTSVLSLMICFWLPNALLGPYWGVLVDRFSKKFGLVFSNLARAVLLFGFALYVSFFPLSTLSLAVLMILSASLTKKIR